MQGGVYLFYNPLSGRFKNDYPSLLMKEFAGLGLHVIPVSDPAQLMGLRQAHIIAAGGDGTLHVAINHADITTNSFSILPVGSGNDFASHFPETDAASIADGILNGRVRNTDLMEVNGVKVHNVCGTGFEAFVAKKAHESSIRWAAMKYIIPVARHLFFYKPIKARIAAGDFSYKGPVFMVSMGNGRRAGGGFRLFPEASLTDGKLDLLIIRPPSFLQKCLYVWLVNFGKHRNLSVVDYLQVESCDIELEEPFIMEADGDIYVCHKMSARILKNALKLVI